MIRPTIMMGPKKSDVTSIDTFLFAKFKYKTSHHKMACLLWIALVSGTLVICSPSADNDHELISKKTKN